MVASNSCDPGVYYLHAFLRCDKDGNTSFSPVSGAGLYQDEWVYVGYKVVRVFPVFTATTCYPEDPLRCTVRLVPSCTDLSKVILTWSATDVAQGAMTGVEADLGSLQPATGSCGAGFNWEADASYAFGPAAALGTVTFNIAHSDPFATGLSCNNINVGPTDYRCCIAEGGTVNSDKICPEPTTSPDSVLDIAISNYENFNLYDTWLVITNLSGQILFAEILDGSQTAGIVSGDANASATPSLPSLGGSPTSFAFDILYSFWTAANGVPAGTTYRVYTYSDPNTVGAPIDLEPVVGANISALGVLPGDICGDTSNGWQVYVPAPFNLLSAPNNTNEGNTGGITPGYYNTDIWTVQGGTPPYSYTWSSTGYVRHAVISSSYATNPPSASVRVIYADNATWHCTITDSNGCMVQEVEATNDVPGTGTNAGAILDIDAYYIKTATYNNSNGAIKLCVSGTNCASPTYQWSGPSSWLTPTPAAGVTGTSYGTGTASAGSCSTGSGNHTFNLLGVPYGWYSVTVSCDLNGDGIIGNNEHSEGWYWVPRSTTTSTGVRGKLDGGILLNALPNPFTSETTVSFGIERGGKATLSVYGIDGKLITTLFDGELEGGIAKDVMFHGGNLPSGVYVVQLLTEDGEMQQTKLMVTK